NEIGLVTYTFGQWIGRCRYRRRAGEPPARGVGNPLINSSPHFGWPDDAKCSQCWALHRNIDVLAIWPILIKCDSPLEEWAMCGQQRRVQSLSCHIYWPSSSATSPGNGDTPKVSQNWPRQATYR